LRTKEVYQKAKKIKGSYGFYPKSFLNVFFLIRIFYFFYSLSYRSRPLVIPAKAGIQKLESRSIILYLLYRYFAVDPKQALAFLA